jgi:hypothetical protein
VTFRFNIKTNRKTITIGGLAGLVLMLGIFSLPALFAASLSPERAKQEIRQHMKWQLGLRQMAEIRSAGLTSPDPEIARHWKEQFYYIDQLEFESVDVRHFLFVPPFTSHRMFIAKIVIRDAKQRQETRYFSLSARNRFYGVFWVAEQARLMWLLSI